MGVGRRLFIESQVPQQHGIVLRWQLDSLVNVLPDDQESTLARHSLLYSIEDVGHYVAL